MHLGTMVEWHAFDDTRLERPREGRSNVTVTTEPQAAGETPAFGFIGGDPCVDFVNTVDLWPVTPGNDRLRSYDDLLAWSVQAGLIDAETTHALRRVSSSDEEEAGRVLARARALRAHLRSILAAISSGESPDKRAVEAIAAMARKAAGHSELSSEAGGYVWTLDPAYRDRLEWPVWELARAAVALLTSDALQHVRECANERCHWMFVDRSRNHSRRWCDMAVCGNRAKARRNYARRKLREAPPAE